MGKVLILSGFDDNMAEVGIRCTATHRAYAAHWGCDHEVVRDYPKDCHPSWWKLQLIRDRITSYDAVVWLDADSIITNMGVSLMEWPYMANRGKVMVISVDWCAPIDAEQNLEGFTGVSCGNFIIRNVEGTERFLSTWAEHAERWKNAPMWEQDGLRSALRSDKWMRDQTKVLHRNLLNAVHASCVNRDFPDAAPYSWRSIDLLCHLTNVDRSWLINSLNSAAVYMETDWIPEWHDPGGSTDKRHIWWLLEVIKATEVKRTLEIGVLDGCASSAFVNEGAEFCDISWNAKARIICNGKIQHQRKGVDVLRSEEHYDLVFVDGSHELKDVEEEVNALLAKPPKIIVAHDVNSTAAGFPHCEGAHYLMERLQQEGWIITIDAKKRPNEKTERGMLMATKDSDLHEIIRRCLTMTCW